LKGSAANIRAKEIVALVVKAGQELKDDKIEQLNRSIVNITVLAMKLIGERKEVFHKLT
jgi:hypothetical protein